MSDLFFPYKTRVAVMGSSGSGKTGLLLELIQYPDFFPPDVKGVIWINITGIEPSAKGFEIFDKEPNYRLLDGNQAMAMLESPNEDFAKHILVLDDCFAKSVSKSTKETLEKQLKRTVNHQDLILFMTVQSTFSAAFDSDMREQSNAFLFIGVSETIKFEAFLQRIIKAETAAEAKAHAKIVRNLTDHKGYMKVDGPFGIIYFKSSEYNFELWGWGPGYPQGVYFKDETKEQYRVAPLE